EGKRQLDELADKLNAHADDVEAIQVDGYTDRLGNYAYNLGLSERRAASGRRHLIDRGVPASIIRSEGHSKDNPVVQCDNANRSELIACLQPNRRVEIAVHGVTGSPLE